MSSNVLRSVEAFLPVSSRDEFYIFLLDNMIWPILLVGFVIFSLLLPEVFSTPSNIEFLLFSSAGLGVLVLAESLCLLSGNFDLSVGSIAGFSAMFSALFVAEWFPASPGIVGVAVALLVGAAIGSMNGFSVAYIGVNPFLQTLAFLIIWRGGVILLQTTTVFSLPASYTYLGGGELGFLPAAIPFVITLYIIMWYFLRYTRTGMAIVSTGGDEQSAAEAGIDTKLIVLLTFTLSGMLSGLAGIIYAGFIGAVTPGLADGTVFSAFAAAVIGGISLFGGRGKILGAFGGVLLLSMINTGLVQLEVETQAVRAVTGLVLLGAVILYTFESRFRTRILSD
jgi:ribose/xylose/arabinose/galactoside ABC-type transport system permease subunit